MPSVELCCWTVVQCRGMSTCGPIFSPSPTPFNHRPLKAESNRDVSEGSSLQWVSNAPLGVCSGSQVTSVSATSPHPYPTSCPRPTVSHAAPAPGPLHWLVHLPSRMSFRQTLRAAQAPVTTHKVVSARVIPDNSGHTCAFRNWKWNYRESRSGLRMASLLLVSVLCQEQSQWQGWQCRK